MHVLIQQEVTAILRIFAYFNSAMNSNNRHLKQKYATPPQKAREYKEEKEHYPRLFMSVCGLRKI